LQAPEKATVGNNGTVTDDVGNVLDIVKWGNVADAEKNYKALEFDSQLRRGAWFLSANVTWADLTGNYVGEGLQSPGSGQYLHNFDVYQGVTQYNWKTYNPTGRLVTIGAQSPLAINGQASHSHDNAYGKMTWGFAYQFRSGQHFDDARTLRMGRHIPDLDANANSHNLAVTQYVNGQRGTGVFNAFSTLDVSVQQDFVITNVKGRAVTGFVKVMATNALNHQQQLTWDHTFNRAAGDDPAAVWTPGANYGKATSSSNYAVPRQLFISAGLKF